MNMYLLQVLYMLFIHMCIYIYLNVFKPDLTGLCLLSNYVRIVRLLPFSLEHASVSFDYILSIKCSGLPLALLL